MKKESSEKCELMGRVGQVVEEKGHLEDRVKTLERSLTSSIAKAEELEQKLQTVCNHMLMFIEFWYRYDIVMYVLVQICIC